MITPEMLMKTRELLLSGKSVEYGSGNHKLLLEYQEALTRCYTLLEGAAAVLTGIEDLDAAGAAILQTIDEELGHG